MSFETTVGILGAINVAVLQIPQVRKIYRDQSAKDLSWFTIFLHLSACVLWFVYGIVINKFPVILANVIYGVANVAVVYLKRKYDQLDNVTPV